MTLPATHPNRNYNDGNPGKGAFVPLPGPNVITMKVRFHDVTGKGDDVAITKHLSGRWPFRVFLVEETDGVLLMKTDNKKDFDHTMALGIARNTAERGSELRALGLRSIRHVRYTVEEIQE